MKSKSSNKRERSAKLRSGDDQSATWERPKLVHVPEDQKPHAIYRNFKRELGEIDSHLCIVDAGLRDLVKGYRSSKHKFAFVSERTREHGHRLAVEQLRFEFALHLAYMSQIALLLARLDGLCSLIQEHCLIDRQLKDRLAGDFLRRALWLVVASREAETPVSPIQNAVAEQYLNPLDLALFDFYRRMRNAELHALQSVNVTRKKAADDLAAYYSRINLSECRRIFHFAPSFGYVTSFEHVLLVSKASQRIAHDLCGAIVDSQMDLMPELVRKFGTHEPSRRRAAAEALLSQTYLLDSAAVRDVLADLAW